MPRKSDTTGGGKRRAGPVERATRDDLRRLPAGPTGESLGALAVALARHIDDGPGLGFAKVAKELRETLTELAGDGGGSHDSVARFLADLSAPVCDTQDA